MKETRYNEAQGRRVLVDFMRESRAVRRQKIAIVASVQRKLKAHRYEAFLGRDLWHHFVRIAAMTFASARGTTATALFPTALYDAMADRLERVEYAKILAGKYDDYTKPERSRRR